MEAGATEIEFMTNESVFSLLGYWLTPVAIDEFSLHVYGVFL